MKKLFITILAILTIQGLSYANERSTDSIDMNKIAIYNKITPIEDELIKSQKYFHVCPEYIRDTSPIIDEFGPNVKIEEGTIKLYARKTDEKIEDELITPKFKAQAGAVSVLKTKKNIIIEDNLAKNLKIKDRLYAKAKTKYDFSKKQIPVQLKIIENLTTKNKIKEGDKILFKTTKEILVKDLKLPKGTKIVGRVETISASDKMGTPANIIIDNFYVQDFPDICFHGNISKIGANRSLWVYPLYQAGNILLYAAGFVFVPIHGGHAKLLTNETYTVFYETY